MTSKASIAMTAVWGIVLLALFLPAMNSRFDDSRANDTTSAYYLNFGRDLVRFPPSATKLLSANLVAGEKPTVVGDPPSFYLDHPPGLSWSVGLALSIQDFVAPSTSLIWFGRWVSVLSSLAIALLIFGLASRKWGSKRSSWAMVGIITSPAFFSHGVVINFEPICCALMVAGFASNHPIGMIPALLLDWPAYFLLVAQAFQEQQRKRIQKALGFLLVGMLIGLAVILYHQWIAHQKSYLVSFFIGAFKPHGAFSRVLHWNTGLKPFLGLVYHNFCAINLLVLAYSTYGWIRNFRKLSPVQFMGLAFVFVTTLNVILFLPWALEHSFWTYYLLVPIALAWIEVAESMPRKEITWILAATAFALAFTPYRTLITSFPGKYVEDECPILLQKSELPIFSDEHDIYAGHGYVARWYFDRPIQVLAAPTPEKCAQGCLWISNHDLPENFQPKPRSSCHYANVWISQF